MHADWIAEFVESPDLIRPLSQQMPKLGMSRDEADIVAAYMRDRRRDSQVPDAVPGDPIADEDIQGGREAFEARGCLACHVTGEGAGGLVGPDLAAVGDRLKDGYIWYHLKNPHAVNPYSPEPDYGLSDGEARALATYLVTKNTGSPPATIEPTSTSEPARSSLTVTQDEAFINRRDEARSAFLVSPQGIYGQYCSHCHGEQGRGDGRLWVTELSPKPADLTSLKADKAYVMDAIRNGSAAHDKSNLCPPQGRTISAENIDRLAEYILSLDSQNEPATLTVAAAWEGEGSPWLLCVVLLAEVALLAWMCRSARRRPAGASECGG